MLKLKVFKCNGNCYAIKNGNIVTWWNKEYSTPPKKGQKSVMYNNCCYECVWLNENEVDKHLTLGIEDFKKVANSLGMIMSNEQIIKYIIHYPKAKAKVKKANWEVVVERMLYNEL